MNPQVMTFADAVQDLEEFCREASISAAGRAVRGAIRRAYREIVDAHDWACLHGNGRIQLQAYQDTGTVEYDHTGGTYERQVTLTGATWPSDIEDWAIRIDTGDNEVVCDVEAYKTASVITLDATMNPGKDVASGATYDAYPRYYRLPNDFMSMDKPVEESLQSLGRYVSMERMLELDRYYNTSGEVQYFTIAAAPDLFGTMALFVQPYSDEDRTLDFTYKRRPRELRYVGTDLSESPGTISIYPGGTATISGASTSFASTHVGSLLRIGTSASSMPTGLDGLLPYAEQRTIVAYTSATSVTLDAAPSVSQIGVKYSITDPIDLSPNVYDAMMALAKKFVAVEKNAKNAAAVAAQAAETLFRAKCADQRVFGRRAAGPEPDPTWRLADSPTANRYVVE